MWFKFSFEGIEKKISYNVKMENYLSARLAFDNVWLP